jgi:hypothetical protein
MASKQIAKEAVKADKQEKAEKKLIANVFWWRNKLRLLPKVKQK